MAALAFLANDWLCLIRAFQSTAPPMPEYAGKNHEDRLKLLIDLEPFYGATMQLQATLYSRRLAKNESVTAFQQEQFAQTAIVPYHEGQQSRNHSPKGNHAVYREISLRSKPHCIYRFAGIYDTSRARLRKLRP